MNYLKRFPVNSVLDYGCGDGTFLNLVDKPDIELMGIDIDSKQIEDCKIRNAAKKNMKFDQISPSFLAKNSGTFPLIFCMEVLEHCIESDQHKILNDLLNLTEEGGIVVISVPIETGLGFLIKELFRKIAAIKNLSQYQFKEKYTLLEYIRMIFANKNTSITRPVYRSNVGEREITHHGHKGFNWMSFLQTVEEKFDLIETGFSPMPALKGKLNSQVWFLLKKRTH